MEELAVQYYKSGEYEKAVELFAQIYDKNPNSYYIYNYYYQALLLLDDYKTLEKVAKKQVKVKANTFGASRVKVDLGYVYDRSGDLEKAEQVYQTAIREVPADFFEVKSLHRAFLDRGLDNYAIATLMKGRKLLNNKKEFAIDLCRIYLAEQQYDKIIDELAALVKGNDYEHLPFAENIVIDFLEDDDDQMRYVILKTALQKQIQKEPDNVCYLSLLSWILQDHKDFAAALTLAKSFDKRAKKDGEEIFHLAEQASENRDYAVAIEALQYLIDKGDKWPYYDQARFKILEVKYLQITSTYPIDELATATLVTDMRKEIEVNGMHANMEDVICKYAYLSAFCLHQPDSAISILEKSIANTVREKKVQAHYKIDLADIHLYMGNVWDATLYYSQVEKDFPNDTIGQTAKFKNAKLSFYIGEFDWAKSQLDVLRAATTKLVANDAMYFSLLISDNEEDNSDEEEENALATNEDDVKSLFAYEAENLPLKYYAKADFLLFRNMDDAALQMLDSVQLLAPVGKLTDDVCFQKSKIYTRKKDFFAAEKELLTITKEYAYDILGDDAWFALGELYEFYLKDTPKAMEAYQKLMKEYPGSIYVIEARKHYRTLRGDFE